MNFEKSNKLRVKAKNLIPAGAHTYSKGEDQFPELSPGFIVKGKGSKVWDPDGNQFLDWGMGLRSVILGHADERILKVVREEIELGSNFTRPSILEAELAEKIVELIPSAEMVKFAKNGSDATTAAVKLARAYTGKDDYKRCHKISFIFSNTNRHSTIHQRFNLKDRTKKAILNRWPSSGTLAAAKGAHNNLP